MVEKCLKYLFLVGLLRCTTDFFMSVGLGIGGSDTPLEEARKSLSCERTFTAISDEEKLFAKLGTNVLRNHCECV
jgi:Ca2+-transporting ATPase/DNA polymerase kappa